MPYISHFADLFKSTFPNFWNNVRSGFLFPKKKKNSNIYRELEKGGFILSEDQYYFRKLFERELKRIINEDKSELCD
jgi:hypothetical protein